MVHASNKTKLGLAACAALFMLIWLNCVAAYVWGVLCFAPRASKGVVHVASAAEDDEDEWQDMTNSTKRGTKKKKASRAVVEEEVDAVDEEEMGGYEDATTTVDEVQAVEAAPAEATATPIKDTVQAAAANGGGGEETPAEQRRKRRMEQAEQRLRDAMSIASPVPPADAPPPGVQQPNRAWSGMD